MTRTLPPFFHSPFIKNGMRPDNQKLKSLKMYPIDNNDSKNLMCKKCKNYPFLGRLE